MKVKSSLKEIVAVNLIIFMVIAMLFLFTVDNRITAVLSPSGGAIYQGNKSKPNVSLMFNVYWGTEYIDGILDVLGKENVKCTFFIGGMWAKTRSEELKKIYDSGQELGNHGYTHKLQSKLDKNGNEYEISQAEQCIQEVTGVKTNLFAPPSGDFDAETVRVAAGLGYQTIMWTKDTIDWRDHNTQLITKRAVDGAQNGAFILMHPTKNTLEALPEIIKEIKAKGYNLCTVTENIQVG